MCTGLYGAIFVKLEGVMTPSGFRKTKIFRVVEEKYIKSRISFRVNEVLLYFACVSLSVSGEKVIISEISQSRILHKEFKVLVETD